MKPKIRRSMPFSDWPRADQLAWTQAFNSKRGLRDKNSTPIFSPATTADLKYRYAQFLSFTDNMEELDRSAEAGATVTEESLHRFVEWLEPHVSATDLAGSVRKVIRVASLLNPKRDFRWAAPLNARLDRWCSRSKPTREVVEIGHLYRLGYDLMKNAERAGLKPLEQAIEYRDGLLIAMLAATALRIGAFVSLQIDETFSFNGVSWHIHLPAKNNSKQSVPIEKPLPKELTPWISKWVEIHRPRFKRAETTQYLWLSRNGILSESQAYVAITRRTKAAFGRRVNPHLFRHSAASSIFSSPEGSPDLARALLNHANAFVTDQNYNHARMNGAVLRLQCRLNLRG